MFKLDERFLKQNGIFLSASSQTNDHVKVEPGVNFTFEDLSKKKVKKFGGDFNLNLKLVYKNVGKENF